MGALVGSPTQRLPRIDFLSLNSCENVHCIYKDKQAGNNAEAISMQQAKSGHSF